jgi:hypothetical protein
MLLRITVPTPKKTPRRDTVETRQILLEVAHPTRETGIIGLLPVLLRTDGSRIGAKPPLAAKADRFA